MSRDGPDSVQITPVGDLSAVEGTMLNITCSANCNPVCDSYRWQNGSDNSSLGSSQSLVIQKVRREHAGVYFCTVTNSAISNSAKVQVKFTVNYAPDVLVDYTGSILTNSTVVLTCMAYGVPSQYIFHEWVHTVGETEIRRLNGEHIANTSILTLPNISMEDMGTYVCAVGNSITGLNGQIKQTGHTDILIRGNPFIEIKNSMFSGMINKSARIDIPFYSNPSSTTVKFYWGANTVEVKNTSDTLIFVSSFLNAFTFYGKEVLLNGQIAVLHFRTVETTEYGEYTAVLSNDIGNTFRRFVFSSGEPETPILNPRKESASSLDIGASVGIGFGGIFIGVVGTISVIIIRKRITATPTYSSTSEADISTEMKTYANTSVSSSPAPSHYEELQKDNMENTVYDRI